MGRLNTTEQTRPVLPLVVRIWLGVWMSAVIAAAFAWLPPARNFADPEAARMVVFHVPCAMLSVLAYVVSTIYAVSYLIKGRAKQDIISAASASLGFLFSALAMATGMVFARVQWGTAWNWDPRETSILMLLMVYAAYFALRSAIPGSVMRAKISSVYNILACLVMPFLVFVLPRVQDSLHPANTLTQPRGLSPEYRIVLGAAMLGFVVLYVWILRIQVRITELAQSKR